MLEHTHKRPNSKKDLDKISSKPKGTTLVKNLQDLPQATTIQFSVDTFKVDSTVFYNTADTTPSDSVIQYNPGDTKGAKDENGGTERPPFVGLAHELGHAKAAASGTHSKDDRGTGKQNSTPPSERSAMSAENAVRREHGLPIRPFYYQE